MQDVLIYGGIALNVIGALLLAIFAVQAANRYKQAENMPVRIHMARADFGRKRLWAWGMILGGTVIAVIGCLVG